MKKSEIVLNGVYGNGKGKIRKVIAEGPQFTLYGGQEETDNLRYRIINDGSKKNRTAGEEGNITRSSFAAWAKEKLPSEH